MEDDGFTSVSYKKEPRPSRNRKGKNRYRERTLDEKLQAREAELRRSGYLQDCRKLLRDALSPPPTSADSSLGADSPCPARKCVVCLGLGSLSDSTKAQDQYVLLKELLLEMEDELDREVPTQFYDPVFTPEDETYLTAQGHSVLSGDHPLKLDRSTLLYIPHGPRTLFEALLAANWTSADQLGRVVLLGNRLDLYDDPTYSGSLQERRKDVDGVGDELGSDAHFVFEASKIFHSVPLPDTKEHLQAFNDLALQWVPPARLADKPDSFWNASNKSANATTTATDKTEAGTQEQQDEITATTDEAAEALEKLALAE
ncbi:hypothetical protein JCM10908_004291 [Rhodotorula pacifica]|uniref:Ber1p n=1 Tax=Rhodotorula pacifica TaxID=1495444 RepID=UPI0031799BB7